MAIMVLALGVMPCADAETVVNDGKSKSEIIKTSDQQDHKDADACSPFCHCACCAGFSINHFIALLTIIPPYGSAPTSRFFSSEVIEVALPIWQPPQLV